MLEQKIKELGRLVMEINQRGRGGALSEGRLAYIGIAKAIESAAQKAFDAFDSGRSVGGCSSKTRYWDSVISTIVDAVVGKPRVNIDDFVGAVEEALFENVFDVERSNVSPLDMMRVLMDVKLWTDIFSCALDDRRVVNMPLRASENALESFLSSFRVRSLSDFALAVLGGIERMFGRL